MHTPYHTVFHLDIRLDSLDILKILTLSVGMSHISNARDLKTATEVNWWTVRMLTVKDISRSSRMTISILHRNFPELMKLKSVHFRSTIVKKGLKVLST